MSNDCVRVLPTEFWLGLRNIHCIATRDDVDLMIDLRQADGNGMTWIYHTFKAGGSSQKYGLHIGEAEGPPIMGCHLAHMIMTTMVESLTVEETIKEVGGIMIVTEVILLVLTLTVKCGNVSCGMMAILQYSFPLLITIRMLT